MLSFIIHAKQCEQTPAGRTPRCNWWEQILSQAQGMVCIRKFSDEITTRSVFRRQNLLRNTNNFSLRNDSVENLGEVLYSEKMLLLVWEFEEYKTLSVLWKDSGHSFIAMTSCWGDSSSKPEECSSWISYLKTLRKKLNPLGLAHGS